MVIGYLDPVVVEPKSKHKCRAQGCFEAGYRDIEGIRAMCKKHTGICPRCGKNPGEGQKYKLGYCDVCEVDLVQATIILPLGVDDGRISKAELELYMGIPDEN